jgi:dTDP-4-amino-4,6-dideoxygalactose transaminase
MNTIPLVDLAAQYRSIENEINQAITNVLLRCDFILGREVEEFEAAFARFIGVRHGIAVSSGMDALRLSLQAFGVREDDEVIIPANTFIACALAVSALGATPVLVDCDPKTYNIDPGLIESAITRRTRAIMPVHFAGQAADMDPILDIARRKQLHIIEDAAQAHGTLYKGRSCGSIGSAAGFSFYPSKNLGAYGDAGLITTNDDNLAQHLRRLRVYGREDKYHYRERGLNARLDTMQAAVLNIKLKYLPTWNEARAEHARRYRQLLAGIDEVQCLEHQDSSTHIYHLFIIETDRRDELQQHLTSAGVQTHVHYPVPIHLQGAYVDLGYTEGAFPHTERSAKRMLSLPMFPELSDTQIKYIVDSIKKFFRTIAHPEAPKEMVATKDMLEYVEPND